MELGQRLGPGASVPEDTRRRRRFGAAATYAMTAALVPCNPHAWQAAAGLLSHTSCEPHVLRVFCHDESRATRPCQPPASNPQTYCIYETAKEEGPEGWQA